MKFINIDTYNDLQFTEAMQYLCYKMLALLIYYIQTGTVVSAVSAKTFFKFFQMSLLLLCTSLPEYFLSDLIHPWLGRILT